MTSFDHLVGAQQERFRDREAERFGGLQINDQFIIGGILHRQLGWLRTSEDAINVDGCLAVLLSGVVSIGCQSALSNEIAEIVNGWQAMPSGKLDDFTAMRVGDRA